VPTGGFDAAEEYPAGEDDIAGRIYHSADGLVWSPLPASPPAELKGYQAAENWHLGMAGPSGSRLVASYWYKSGGDSLARLLTSSPDGSSWTLVSSFPDGTGNVDTGIPPTSAGGSWFIGGSDGHSIPTVWTSTDLATWTTHPLPIPAPATTGAVSEIAPTSEGFVAVGSVSNADGTAAHASWLNTDGADWVALPPPSKTPTDGPDVIADGPVGTIGFGVYNGSEVPPGVWQLHAP